MWGVQGDKALSMHEVGCGSGAVRPSRQLEDRDAAAGVSKCSCWGRGVQGCAKRGRKWGEEIAKPRCGRGKMHGVGPTQFRDTNQHPRVIQG